MAKRPITNPRPSSSQPAVIAGLGVDLPELQKARALWQLNRFDEALALFENTVRKYPQNLVALIDASRALGARFEIARAEEVLDRLMKVAAKRPDLLHLAGQSYRMIFRPEKAIACFERVLAMTQEIPDARLELAMLYERRHRVDDAFRLMEECLRAEPDYLEAALVKGRLLRRLKEETAAENLFRALARSEKGHPLLRAQAWSEIAQLLDRRGDYDEAMSAMLQCKEILRAQESGVLKESEAIQGHLTALASTFTREHFERWSASSRAIPLRRMALLASFPRSGTTLIEQVLDSHSELVSSDEREAFARDIFPAMWRTASTSLPTIDALDNIPAERLVLQRERYLGYMSAALNEPIGNRIHLDKNPTLTLLLPGMLRLFPETKCLIALRDPRDVVISCFMQYLPLNTNSVCFLTLERTAGRYAQDMGMWRNLREKLPATSWLEIRYEDAVMDLEREARRAVDFLNLPWEDGVLHYRERLKEKAVNSPTYEAVSKPIYTQAIGRWKNYQKYLEPCLETLEASVKAFGYTEYQN